MGWQDTIQDETVDAGGGTSWRDTIQHENTTPGQLESLVRGGAQGASLGFADELAGALHNPLGALKKAASYVGYSPDANDTDVKEYIKRKLEYEAGDKAAQEANPWTYGLSQVGGGVLTPGLGALGALKGGKALLGAAALGATQGVGSSDADTLGGLAKDTAIGTGAGLVGHGVGSLVGRAIPSITGSRELAVNSAIEHLRPTPNVARVIGPDRLREIAAQALDTGQIGFGAKVGQTAEKLGLQREDLGSKIGAILESSDAKINPRDVAQRIEDEVIKPLQNTAEGTGIAAGIKDKVDRFLSKYAPDDVGTPSIGVSQLEAEKRAVQGNINYNTDPKAKTQAVRDYANILKTSAEDAIDNPDFNSLKKQFSNTATAQQIADRSAALTDSGTGLIGHLYDLGAGNVAGNALMHGNPLGAAGLGARMLARGKTKSAIAVGANSASKFLEGNPVANMIATQAEKYAPQATETYIRQHAPYTRQSATSPEQIMEKIQRSPQAQKYIPALQQAAQQGNDSLATTTFILNQTDPEFQRAMQDDSN